MAKEALPLIASEDQMQELLVMRRSTKIEKRYSQRAEVILLSLEKKTLDEIMLITRMSRPVINKWRQRFRKSGPHGLHDEPRPGKPSVITAEQKAMVVQKACEKPPAGYTSWSQVRIGEAVGISQSKVFQILRDADLKPHKIDYWCGKSPDPEFEAKMTGIVGLYMNPPENAIVLCVDEKTQIQALDRTQPILPLKVHQPKRITSTYKRNGTAHLIAALAVHTGQITAQTMESNNSEKFLSFLKKLDRKYRNKKLHIICDNLAVHKNQEVKQWLESKQRKIQLHFTPTYSSWLNQIEIWFNILTKDVLKGGIWKSKEQLVSQMLEYINTYNQTRAKPFAWTYTGNTLKVG